jgi:uncharacterized Zn finger protein
MKSIELKVKSSSQEYYLINIEISEVFKISCNCKAGIFGKLCKHKAAVLSGDLEILYNQEDEKTLIKLQEIVKMSDLNKLTNELEVAEKAIESAKNQAKEIKIKLERSLKNGIIINL